MRWLSLPPAQPVCRSPERRSPASEPHATLGSMPRVLLATDDRRSFLIGTSQAHRRFLIGGRPSASRRIELGVEEPIREKAKLEPQQTERPEGTLRISCSQVVEDGCYGHEP